MFKKVLTVPKNGIILIPRCNGCGEKMTNDLRYANDNIKLLIKYNGWTQAALCKKTGISSTILQRRLNCKISKWTMMEAVSIATAFSLTVNDIFFTHMVPKCIKELVEINKEIC